MLQHLAKRNERLHYVAENKCIRKASVCPLLLRVLLFLDIIFNSAYGGSIRDFLKIEKRKGPRRLRNIGISCGK
jgi:hypothetical protein